MLLCTHITASNPPHLEKLHVTLLIVSMQYTHTNLLAVVHLCPIVPTAAKSTDLTTISTSAS